MTRSELLYFLSTCGYSSEADQTRPYSYAATPSKSSIIAAANGNRLQSGWKTAKYVVAKFDNNPGTLSDCLEGWKAVTSKYQDQFLCLEDKNGEIHFYDASGREISFNEAFPKRPNNARSSGYNIIYYGAPGTGKSFEAKKQTIGKPHIRTIFHPDSDYASFIGCYKPVMENGKIVYKYRAQAFINAYINSWLTNDPYFLVIEEINRGNCAQIFGDIFQLLDRTEGESDYDVYPDTDLQQYIKDTFTVAQSKNAEQFNRLSIPEEILSGSVMRLPKNLSIIATMNTSDQSLFPMDSAFKRRWNWKFFAIRNEHKDYKIVVDDQEYDWWKTIEALNEKILVATKSSDKQIGYWFAKLPDNQTVIDAERFVSKVVFYLWNDIFKDFSFGVNNPFTKETTFEAFFDARGNVVLETLKLFLDRNFPNE